MQLPADLALVVILGSCLLPVAQTAPTASACFEQGVTASGAPAQSIVDALKNQDRQAIDRLGPAAFDPLIAALKHQDAVVRKGAADGLGRLRDPRAVAALLFALKDADSSVRFSVVGAHSRRASGLSRPAVTFPPDCCME
jgi:HEAT repeat protein